MPKFNATEYANKYISKNYDRLSLALPAGMKLKLQNHVDENKEKYKSITDLLIQSVNAQIERDGGTIEPETDEPALKPTFRVDSMDYPTGMLDSPNLEELRKRREEAMQKRNAAKEDRDAFRTSEKKEDRTVNNIGELFLNLGKEQDAKEQAEKAEEEVQ